MALDRGAGLTVALHLATAPPSPTQEVGAAALDPALATDLAACLGGR